MRKFTDGTGPRTQLQGVCALCRGEIYPGEYYYETDDGKICESCLGRYARRYFDRQYRRLLAAEREDT